MEKDAENCVVDMMQLIMIFNCDWAPMKHPWKPPWNQYELEKHRKTNN